ncbi:MAG: hypothetical protein ACTHJN_12520 [Ginsengibacter sp.]
MTTKSGKQNRIAGFGLFTKHQNGCSTLFYTLKLINFMVKQKALMQEISIEIPEAQVPFMMELLQKFNFVKINRPADKKIKLTKRQIKLIEEERTKSKKEPDYLLDWDKVKDSLKTD